MLLQQHSRVQGSLPWHGPSWKEETATGVKHKYQPRIQEWGLAKARVGVHWAAGGEVAQRESTYKRHRISERSKWPILEAGLAIPAHPVFKPLLSRSP